MRRACELVDAVVGQRRQEAGDVAVVLGDRVLLPELADRLDLGRVDLPFQQFADIHQRQYSQAVSHLSAVRARNRRTLTLVLALTLAITAVEVVGGLLTGSLALLADAVHMLSDNVALGLALVAVWLAGRPSTPERSFGYQRAEVLAALVNGLVLVALAIWIFVEAYGRLSDPPDVLGGWMLAVASSAWRETSRQPAMLARTAHGSLNMQAALRHVTADALGSGGVVVAALVILTTGWRYADPAVGALIAVLVLASSWTVLRDSVHILLEGTPRGIDARGLARRMAGMDGVVDVHDLHVWTITSGFRGPLCPRSRRAGRRLPRPAARARARARRGLRHRAHDAPGRPRLACEQRRLDPTGANVSDGESQEERLNRELIELLNELRVVLPGVQVLFAFLLTVPFTNQFRRITHEQELVFFVTFLLTAIATILLISPSAYHRLRWRQKDKEQMLQTANRLAISGMAFLAAALTGAVYLLTDLLFASAAVVYLVTAAAGALVLWFWYGLALTRRAQDPKPG